MSYLGTTKIGKMYLGSTGIAKAYLGDDLVFQKGGSPSYRRLPEGFTELAYVATDSNAWIDTGVAGATDLSITVRFEVDTYVQYGAIYGNHVDASHKANRLLVSSASTLTAGGGNNISTTVSGFSINRIHTVSVSPTAVYLESETTSITADSNAANTTNICLGANKVTTPTERNIGLRLFAFRIKKNGTAILNYVPAKRDYDSAIGFYDLVNETFVKSETGTSFTAGPVAEYSDQMLKCLDWSGSNNPYSSRWYEPIGHQYWTLSNATHGSDYYEFINSSPASVSQYATLFGSLPDLGYRWKMIVDLAVRTQSSNPSTFCPIDFGSLGSVAEGTCSTSITLSGSGTWSMNTKFNPPTESSVYAPSDRNLSSETITTSQLWIRRTVTIGVRASETSGKDETFMIVSEKGDAKSDTPYNPLRFNRWNTPMYIARSLANPSSSNKYATSTRIYSIKVYYEPII